MNGMHGIIFSYDKENGLRELIENRVHGSIPFGGDYRIIDFILSSMVNAFASWSSTCLIISLLSCILAAKIMY
jgi:glucose-1-phosphate adenylyltransferase